MPDADDVDIDIVAAPAELDALEPLWIALHRHHRTVVPSAASSRSRYSSGASPAGSGRDGTR